MRGPRRISGLVRVGQIQITRDPLLVPSRHEQSQASLKHMRPFEQMLAPDARFSNMGRLDPSTGALTPIQMRDLYDLVKNVELGPAVPGEIRDQFDLAKSIFAYSWFAYEFATIAEGHAYGVLEMALRVRIELAGISVPPWKGLKLLLKEAGKQGWIDPAVFEVPSPLEPGKTLSILDNVINLRNRLSHGRSHLLPSGSLDMMKLFADTISALFDNKL
ncbi:MAG: hypothetical protein JWN34_5405 [Bryobacterales bacterium]|nr:hypothetical protein [Bryobacterales bacterium]